MSALALKGHETRGREVIELLKMLGGYDNKYCFGNSTGSIYYISVNGCIEFESLDEHHTVFTLEQFEEKYPYKVGDKVIYQRDLHFVKRMKWNGEEIRYKIDYGDGYSLADIKVEELEPYKEKEETMGENVDKSRAPKLQSQDYSGKRFGYRIPDGYEFDCVDNGEMIIKPKQPQYPKTYEECCEVLGMQSNLFLCLSSQDIGGEVEEKSYGYKMAYQMNCLYELLVCRDAYWKMAGDWSFKIGSDSQDVVYAITVYGSGIMKNFYYALNCNCVLVFPTEEMRDAFYENFEELIEKCKELL